MRKYEDLFLGFWVVRVREFRWKSHFSQERFAENLHLGVRNYQKLERGVHKPSAITLLLFLRLLSDQESLTFIHAFGKLVDTGHSEEVARPCRSKHSPPLRRSV